MKPSSKLTRRTARPLILVSLILVLLLAGCELPRPGGDSGDAPGLTTPIVQVSPPATGEAQPSTPPATSEAPLPTEPPATTEAPPPTEPVATVSGGEQLDVGPPAPQAPPAGVIVEGKVLLKLRPQASVQALEAVEDQGQNTIQTTDIPSLDQRLTEIGGSLEPVVAVALPDADLGSLSVQTTEVSQIYTVSFSPDQNEQEVIDILEQDPTVEYAELNYVAGITAAPRYIPLPPPSVLPDGPDVITPNDPLFSYQWHMQTIQMPSAWDRSTGQGITVAIVDTGVDFRAPDLARTTHDQGHDFVNNDDDPTDDQGHGTHVAGTVAQSTNNGVGVAGVAFDARILPVKVLGANGQGSYDNIIKGIVYAVDQGAKVINMSLAGSGGSQALRDAVQYANSKGVVVVAAAGNSGGAVQYPAAYDEFVIGVGAVRHDLQRPAYSNFGSQIDLMAPGGDLSVDQNSDGYADGVLQQSFKTPGTFTYLFFEGTSMASPHIAGLAALILSRDPSLTPAMVENLMAQTANPVGSGGQNGAGVIQAAAAMAALDGQLGPTPTTPAPLPTTPVPTTPAPTPTTPVPMPTFTATPTPTTAPVSEHGADLTPAPVCTPPACRQGEVYYCPSGDCPGGCGTQCATPTPLPTFTSTPTTPAPGPITPTPTPMTPPPPPAGELLLNGGFESDEGWVFGETPIRGGFDTNIKLGGARSVRLGNVSGPDVFSFSSVWQRVTIPAQANQVTLRVNIYPVSQDGPGSGDAQTIMILNNRFRVIDTLSRTLSNSQTWENHAFDLSNLKGQTIYIYFGVVNGGWTGRPTAMYVDDVSLAWQ